MSTAAIRYADGYLYVSNRGHDSITCFRAVGDTLERQHLQLPRAVPAGFHHPRSHLICTNENDDSATAFAIKTIPN